MVGRFGMHRERRALVEDLHSQLEISLDEAELYVSALTEGRWRPSGADQKKAAESLSARGMLIMDGKGGSYLAVHPRLALSNLFRAYEEKLIRQRKEKRLFVDKLTLELLPLLPGESKGTNGSASRGGRRATP
jgi:hypothetical protein